MRKLMLVTISVILAMAVFSGDAPAQEPKIQTKTIFARPLIWRSDSSGGYTFKGIVLSGAAIAKDGSVVSGAFQGACELPVYHQADGSITGLSATWSFTGIVTMEVSVTGSAKNYLPVINGAPLTYKEPASGTRIKWRATLAPGSSLTSLKIVYSDLSGMAGSFGNELLSGFAVRRLVYIKGSTAGSLFNHQIFVKLGESQKSATPGYIKLNGGILSDFADVRFTLPDGETVLPHYLDNVTGKAPDRVASFWVRIPEIPKDGLPIYVYHGKALAADLSSGEKVFDFFDDFKGPVLDPKKWKVTQYDASGKAAIVDSLLSLERARITSANYGFASGLIEYKARASAAGAAALIIRAASTSDGDLTAYSSVASLTSGHSIARGTKTETNAPKPISSGVFYTYKIYCDDNGDVAFRRYGEDGSGSAQAETAYSAGPEGDAPIGLSSSLLNETMDCQWIRTRKAANPPPQVDLDKTAATVSEPVNLPEFSNVSTAPDGSLIPAGSASEGYYMSRLVIPTFEARVLKPSWETGLSAQGVEAIPISIAAKKSGKLYPGWVSGKVRYASKKEFEAGSQLRWKAVIAKQSPSLQSFTLEYWPGDIRIAMPKGGETLTPGTEHNIFWEALGYDPKYPMEISYSIADRKDFKVIAKKVDNSGDYAWNVPVERSDMVTVKVADYNDKSIYGISEDYFSIATGAPGDQKIEDKTQGIEEAKPAEEAAPAAEQKAEETPAPVKKSLAGYYDLLIKVGDNPSDVGYKDGDVIMVKPAGYLWGAEEKGKFLIVRARLTPEKVSELMKPEESVTIAGDTNRKVTTVLKHRKYRFHIDDKITLQERAAALQGHLTGEPKEIADIAGMTEKK